MTSVRSYEKTHPWLTFELNLKPASAKFWVLLGECQSKCFHIAGTPLLPEIAKKMHQLYLAKGVLATTAIEGNTLSEDEVIQHLEGKLVLPPSREYLSQEIDNIKNECNKICGDIVQGVPLSLSVETIKNMNRAILRNLPSESEVFAGEIRKRPVRVGRYAGAPHEDCEFLLDKLCHWLQSPIFDSPDGLEFVYATIKAIIAHLYLAWIHPFEDGNGRTARLIEFQILISSGLPAPASHLLSNHYNLTRTEYYRQLDRASSSGGDVIPFILYSIQGFADGLKAQIEKIREYQLETAWENFVHGKFKDKDDTASQRQKHLILDLSTKSEPVLFEKIREVSTRVAIDYSKRTLRTMWRDIKSLKKMELILVSREGIVANKDIISAFLPIKLAKKTQKPTE